ncbi:DUF6292 family protein [Streptomyces sp. NPDC018693]|uniref:DUF6292 family protein n=1 Tax=unclassified Streptomyces TaxID=2593676 RepID=UPI0037ABDC5D
MPLDVPLHESHRAYIRAVAAALTQAGISVADVDFLEDVWDDGEPIRCAHIHLARLATMQVYGVRKVWMSWTEERGWNFHVAAPDSIVTGLTHPLCNQVLPAPAELLAVVQAALTEQPEPTGRPHPAYRFYGDHDEALEAQLDAHTMRITMEGNLHVSEPEAAMAWVPGKVLAVEAVMPDGKVHGKWTMKLPDTPAAVLEFFERQMMEVIRREYPGAAEYRTAGWKDAQVEVYGDEIACPDLADREQP